MIAYDKKYYHRLCLSCNQEFKSLRGIRFVRKCEPCKAKEYAKRGQASIEARKKRDAMKTPSWVEQVRLELPKSKLKGSRSEQ